MTDKPVEARVEDVALVIRQVSITTDARGIYVSHAVAEEMARAVLAHLTAHVDPWAIEAASAARKAVAYIMGALGVHPGDEARNVAEDAVREAIGDEQYGAGRTAIDAAYAMGLEEGRRTTTTASGWNREDGIESGPPVARDPHLAAVERAAMIAQITRAIRENVSNQSDADGAVNAAVAAIAARGGR